MTSKRGPCHKQRKEDVQNFRIIHAQRGVELPGMCRNPFGCRAGARPWSTNTDLSHEKCRACHLKHGDEPAWLLPWGEIKVAVDCCPVCYWLFGKPVPESRKNGGIRKIELPSLEEVRKIFESKTLMMKACSFCGLVPSKSIELFHNASQCDMGKKEFTLCCQFDLDYSVLAVLYSALGHIDDDMCMRIIKDCLAHCLDRSQQFERIYNRIISLASNDVYAAKVLIVKLQSIRKNLENLNYLQDKNHLTV